MPGMPGEPGMPGAPGMPGMPGMPGEGGGQAQTEVPVANLQITAWCRGVDAWPYMQPTDVYRGDIDKAIKFFEQQLTEEPKFNLGYTSAALAHIAAGDVQRGIEIQRAWTVAQGDSAADLHNYGVVLHAADRIDEAVAQFRRALDAKGGPFDLTAVAIASTLADAGRYEEAVTAYREGIERFPLQRVLRLGLGQALLELGQAKEAVEAFQLAWAMDHRTMDAYAGLIEAYSATGYWSKVLTVAKQATQELPRTWSSWAALADAYVKTGRMKQALEAAQHAVEVGGQEAGAYQALGEVLYHQGDYKAAEQAFQQAVRLNPRSSKPQLYLAKTRLYGDDVAGAAELLRQALLRATDKDMPECCRDYARALFFQGELDDALEMIRLSQDYQKESADAIMLRSFVRLYQDDEQAAWDDFSKALGMQDGDRTIPEAIAVFEGAANNDRKPLALACLGVLAERTGDVARAREWYRKYRAQAPKGLVIQFVDERLEATRGR